MARETTPMNKTLRVIGLAALLLGPTLALASGGGHDGAVVVKDFAYRVFNFALMVGLLVYFVSKPIRNGLKERREGIVKALAEAEQAQVAAEAKFAEYSAKLAKATEEIAEIAASIRREGELERDRILATAKEMAGKIELEAEAKASTAVARARTELREEAVRLAVELAEQMLRKEVTTADQKRLVDEYMQKVGELH